MKGVEKEIPNIKECQIFMSCFWKSRVRLYAVAYLSRSNSRSRSRSLSYSSRSRSLYSYRTSQSASSTSTRIHRKRNFQLANTFLNFSRLFSITMVHCQWKRVTYSFWQNIDGFRVCRDTVHGHGLGLSPDDNSRLDPVDSLVIGSTSACCAASNDAFVSRTGNIRKRRNCGLN